MLGSKIYPFCCASPSTPCFKKGTAICDVESHEAITPSLCLSSPVEEVIEKPPEPPIVFPAGPRHTAVPTYCTTAVEPFQGKPLYTGTVMHLEMGGVKAAHEKTMKVYVNGFSLTSREQVPNSENWVVQPWSPFSLVEKHDGDMDRRQVKYTICCAVFKLAIFQREGEDLCYYFAITGDKAREKRDQMIEAIVGAVRQVTLSLFPSQHSIVVSPVPGVRSTSTRIMAGYLLRCQAADHVSLFYCELHAYLGGEARLAAYKDEWCEWELASLLLTERTVVSTPTSSHYCTAFGIDSSRFAARTVEEKNLWLRAVSNVKVKLMFDAPDPTEEDLTVIRSAVQARVESLEQQQYQDIEDARELSTNPLLPVLPRQALPLTPGGDACHMEPTEETPSEVSKMSRPTGDVVTPISQERPYMNSLSPREPDERVDERGPAWEHSSQQCSPGTLTPPTPTATARSDTQTSAGPSLQLDPYVIAADGDPKDVPQQAGVEVKVLFDV